jgi:hypothetical protein
MEVGGSSTDDPSASVSRGAVEDPGIGDDEGLRGRRVRRCAERKGRHHQYGPSAISFLERLPERNPAQL